MVIKLDIENEKLSLLAAQNEHPDVTNEKIDKIYQACAAGRGARGAGEHGPARGDMALLHPSSLVGSRYWYM